MLASEEALKERQANMSRWMTVEEVADYLQASKEKIYKLCQRGRMPASKFGNQWRFDKSEIDNWLRAQRPYKTKKRKLKHA